MPTTITGTSLATSTITSSTITSTSIDLTTPLVEADGGTGTTRAYSLVTGTAQAGTGTSIEFTGIPSWAKRVTVMINGLSLSLGASKPIQIQLGDSGGIETTGYVALGGAFATSGATGVLTSSLGFPISNTFNPNSVFSGFITFVLLDQSTNTWVASGSFNTQNTTVASGQGSKALSSTLTQLRIISSDTGNPIESFDAGTVNIMYEG